MSSSLCSCGQGTCVESPLPQFQTLCLCHNGFSGRADYFDLRVFINSTTELSLSCPVSEIATNVVWTLFLLAYTVRFGVTMYVLVVLGHMKKLRSISKKLMLFDLFGCIFALSIPIQKLWFDKESVFGTSPLATFCQVTSNFYLITLWCVSQIEEFKILTNIRSWNQYKVNPLAKFHLKLQVYVLFTYFVIGVLSFIALGLDKSKGPLISKEVVILVLRNVSFLFWSLFLFVGVIKVQERERSTRILLGTSSATSAAYINNNRSVRVVKYLERHKSAIKKQVIVASLLYIIFSIPPLWEFQFVNIGLTNIISALTSSIGHVFLRSEWEANRGSISHQKTTEFTTSTQQVNGERTPSQHYNNNNFKEVPVIAAYALTTIDEPNDPSY